MSRIETLYLVNRTHTDIGFTDYQDICFRQHCEFIDEALDLIEATQDYPDEAQFRWTNEATGALERWFDQAPSSQIDRFRYWHEAGYMDVTGMQYPHFTQAHTNEQMHRSLYPVRRFREEFGLTVDSAIQSDVTGVAWRFADLLPAAGMEFMTMSINVHRALAPEPRPGAFWWEGPSGRKVLVWNGFFYLWGRSLVRLGDWRFVDRLFPQAFAKIEADPTYPYEFLFTDVTHPTRVDNGPPDPRMPDFVKEWNAQNRTPRLVHTTVSEFGRMLKQRAAELPTLRGDWTDWWTNGYGSSAYEVGVNRATHDLLASSEAIEAWLAATGQGTWDASRAKYVYDQAILGDELAWGAHSSWAAPYSLFSRAHWNKKQNCIYTASMESHDLLARAAHGLADTVSDRGPDGVFNLGDLRPEEAYPDTGMTELLVINTLPWAREVVVEEPELRGNAAPVGMLESFFPRGVPWGGERPIGPIRRVRGRVPGSGYAFLPIEGALGNDDLRGEPGLIENAFYRLRIDPATGGLAQLLDKELGHDFATTYEGWRPGQYVYEWLESDQGRNAQFTLDYSRADAGIRHTDTPYVRETVSEVVVREPVLADGRVEISVSVMGPGIREGRCTYSLESGTRFVAIDWWLDKLENLEPESVYFAFPFNMGAPTFTVDLGGAPVIADEEQLNNSCRDWYPVQRWVGVSDGERGVVLSPLEAPLVQLGAVTTQRWATELRPEGGNLIAWPMNNHWEVNFRASQPGEVTLRYRLTTHDGPTDAAAAARFGAEQHVSPIVLRDRIRSGPPQGSFLSVSENADVLLHPKPADDGDGVIVRVENLRRESQEVALEFLSGAPREVLVVSPIESDGAPVAFDGANVAVSLAPSEIVSLRARFA